VADRRARFAGNDHGAARFLGVALAGTRDRLSLSAAARTHMNRPRISPLLRLQFLGVLMLLGLGALAARLWWVQVARGADWTARIRGSSEATVRIPSIRGEIRDRNGTSLVQNRASYEVDFYLPEMVKGYRQRYGQPPLTVYRGNVSGMPKDLKEADIVKIVNDGIVTKTLPHQHRSSLHLHQGHQFSDDGEVFRARRRIARSGHSDQAGALLCLWRARGPPPGLRRSTG
jgi:hypothetical protein